MTTETVYVEIHGDEQSFHFATAAEADDFTEQIGALITAAGYEDDEWSTLAGQSSPATVDEAIATAKDLWALDA